MKHLTLRAIAISFSLLLQIFLASGQELISVREITLGKVSPQDGFALAVSGRLSAMDTKPAALFRAVEKQVSEGVFDPAAQPVLSAAEALAKDFFRVPSLQFQRAVTQKNTTGDTLIAEWSIQEPFGKGFITVTDTLFATTYNLRLSDCQIVSRTDLATFLSKALNVGKDPNSFVHGMIYAYVLAGAPVIDHFRVVLPTPPRQVDRGLFSGMGAALDGKDWFIDVQLAKDDFGRKFYPEPPFIPERFPSLAEQARNWGSSHIRSEIGKPVKLQPNGWFDFSEDRNRILVAELIRRGLSEDQLVDLLRDVPVGQQSDEYASRLSIISAAFLDVGDNRLSSLFFQPVLKLYEQIGPPADEAVARLFMDATGPKQCSPTFEAQAIATLKKGIFANGPFRYLSVCSVSRETIAELETMNMPTEQLERQRKETLATIRHNIEHPLRNQARSGTP